MITQEEIDKKKAYLSRKYHETGGQKWTLDELQVWDRVEETLQSTNDLRFEIHLRDQTIKRQNEMLETIEKVFESLNFLGEDSFRFTKNPKPLSGFYTLEMLKLIPKTEPFREHLKSYFNGISYETIAHAYRVNLERAYEDLRTPRKSI